MSGSLRCEFCFTPLFINSDPLCAQCESKLEGHTDKARAEGAATEREACAALADSAAVSDRRTVAQRVRSDAALSLAERIRARGSAVEAASKAPECACGASFWMGSGECPFCAPHADSCACPDCAPKPKARDAG